MRYAALASFVMLQVVSGQAQDPKNTDGTWTAELRTARVFVQLRTSAPDGRSGDTWNGDWTTGQTIAVEELSGLPVADERFTASALKFELRCEAGTFAFDGAFRDGRGAGLFVFPPRSEYLAEMRAIGYADDPLGARRKALVTADASAPSGAAPFAATRERRFTNDRYRPLPPEII